MTLGDNTYTYNENGDLIEKVNSEGSTTFSYDTFGALQSATLPDGTLIEYASDHLQRRSVKKVNGVIQYRFMYQSQLQVAAMLDENGEVLQRYGYYGSSNVPDVIWVGPNNSQYTVVKDHLGSVRMIVSARFPYGTAQVIEYDEFGNVISDSNPGFQPFGFAGGIYDQDTKLVRFGARDYDAETGSWTQKDPIGFEGQDSNIYSYGFQDPINNVDPTGTISTDPQDIFECLTGTGAQSVPDNIRRNIDRNKRTIRQIESILSSADRVCISNEVLSNLKAQVKQLKAANEGLLKDLNSIENKCRIFEKEG